MSAKTPHYHVATGIAGYGPDGADGYACYATLGDALDGARDELRDAIDMTHETAHSFGDAGQFEDAWREILRMETLEILRANLDPARETAPLYRDDPDAYAALQRTQADEFPHDISYNSRLYLWRCDETDCDHCDES